MKHAIYFDRRTRRDAMNRMLLAVALALALGGCASPESNRVRGGGAGADVGNRSGSIEMHAGSQPYWKTPQIIASQNQPPASA